MKNKKILMFAIFMATILFSLNPVSATENIITTYDVGDNITLRQGCDCSFVNFSELFLNENGMTIISDVEGLEQSNGYFTYEVDSDYINKSGVYTYTGIADAGVNNSIKPFSYNIEVVDTGVFAFNLNNNLNLIILTIGLLIGIILYFTVNPLIGSTVVTLVGLTLLFNAFSPLFAGIITLFGLVGLILDSVKS